MIAAILLSYLAGSVPTAYIIVRAVKGIDIRKHGSGNVGATNVFRVAGKGLGILVFLLDVAKGFLTSFMIARLFDPGNESVSLPHQVVCGAVAIVGHTWPIWLKFKGGKGVATSCGVFLGITPLAVSASLVIWITLAYLTKYVSIASMSAAVTFPIWIFLFYHNLTLAGMSAFLAGFIVFTHRSNITRLLQGSERRIGEKKH